MLSLPARFLLFCIALMLPVISQSETLRIGVAANFAAPARELARRFEARTGHEVVISVASTGKLYAQIVNGAPLDMLLAADSERPALLEKSGPGLPGSRFTYALGRLVLWSRDGARPMANGAALRSADVQRIALANPRLAPYGLAAQQALQTLNLWDDLQPKIVRGESIGQTFQFVATGNAEVGFIAAAQLQGKFANSGAIWRVPENLYSPIVQQAVSLRSSAAVQSFANFLRGAEARALIVSAGYAVPQE